MEFSLTKPKGLYFVVLLLTILLEVVIGLVEVAMYVGVLTF